MTSLLRGLTGEGARTDPGSADPALLGRTYAIPFEQVWQAALALASGGLPRWRLVRSDDQEGVVEAEARTRFLRAVDRVRIRIRLDHNAQTRVDVESRPLKRRADLGRNRRRIRALLGALDRALHAGPRQILDAAREAGFTS